MPAPDPTRSPQEPRGHLPRLEPEWYRGSAVVFWTHSIDRRSTGWLDAQFPALRSRDYALLFTNSMFSAGANWALLLGRGWLVFEITGSSTAVGLVTFAGMAPFLFASPVAGALADRIDQLVAGALERGRLCSNDPFCSMHDPENDLEKRYSHGAACHGCLLIAETSCEQRNQFLDRAFVVPTLDVTDAAFFPAELP